jgi:nucleoredoxin
LLNAKGEKIPVADVEAKHIGLYFSASWCPPCRAFTPSLAEAYKKWKAAEKPIELILVGSDRDQDAMLGYMKKYEMPWLALPYDAEPAKIGEKFGIRGIPALVILDQDGKVVTRDGRKDVASHGAKALERWAPDADPSVD